MSIIVEPVLTVREVNTNNHHEHSPFYAVGDLVYVDAAWWYSLQPTQRGHIRSYFGENYGYAVRRNVKFQGELNDAFWKFYSAYINSYNISHWVRCMAPPYSIGSINQATLDGLITLSKKCIMRERKITKEDTKFYYPLLVPGIRKYFETHKATGIFMKISDKSSKRSKTGPIYTLEEMVERIVHDQHMIQSLIRYGTRSSLFLTPWRYEIDSRNEFRVIVNDMHITGVSQQQCYKYVGLTSDVAKASAEAIVELYNRIKDKIPYASCVLDVWVDDTKANLIEINPGEMWASSGSSLFNWVADQRKLYQKKNIYVRYIDIQSPLVKSIGSPHGIGSPMASLTLDSGSSIKEEDAFELPPSIDLSRSQILTAVSGSRGFTLSDFDSSDDALSDLSDDEAEDDSDIFQSCAGPDLASTIRKNNLE